MLNVKIDQEDYEIIANMRDNYHINISALIRDMLSNYYKKIKDKKDKI